MAQIESSFFVFPAVQADIFGMSEIIPCQGHARMAPERGHTNSRFRAPTLRRTYLQDY